MRRRTIAAAHGDLMAGDCVASGHSAGIELDGLARASAQRLASARAASKLSSSADTADSKDAGACAIVSGPAGSSLLWCAACASADDEAARRASAICACWCAGAGCCARGDAASSGAATAAATSGVPSTPKITEFIAVGAAGGCLPVVVVPSPVAEGARRQLPYASTWLDYCSIAYLIPEAAVTNSSAMKVVLDRLDAVTADEAAERRAALRNVRDAFVARDFRSSLFCFPHRLWSHGRAFLGLDISLDMSLRARPRERYVLTNVPSFRRGIHTG